LKSREDEIYISVDVKASGPIPGEYSMLSVGACEVGKANNGFYAELQQISEKYVKEALEVCGLSMENLRKTGMSPHEAMRKFAEWTKWTAGGRRPVFVGYNAGFDWSFVNYYFIRFAGENPYGVSSLDIKSVWLGMTGSSWSGTSKTHVKRNLGIDAEHTHNALDDAKEQAIIFEKMQDRKTREVGREG
jgi:DNA polymerase III epsilon subunit-like protein